MLLKLNWTPKINSSYLEDWMFLILVLSLVFLVFIKIKNEKSIRELFISIFKPNGMSKESKGQVGWTDSERIVLITVYFLITSLFLTVATKHFAPKIVNEQEVLGFFGLFAVLVLGVFMFRLLILSLIKLIAGSFELFQEYSFSIGQSNRFIGISLIPITLLMIVLPVAQVDLVLYIGVFVIVIIYLLRILRLIINSLSIKSGIFYIILYLCIFEILPFLYAVQVSGIFIES